MEPGPNYVRVEYQVFYTTSPKLDLTNGLVFQHRKYADGKIFVWDDQQLSLARNEKEQRRLKYNLDLVTANPEEYARQNDYSFTHSIFGDKISGSTVGEVKKKIQDNIKDLEKSESAIRGWKPSFHASVLLAKLYRRKVEQRLDFAIPNSLNYPYSALEKFNFKVAKDADFYRANFGELTIHRNGEIILLDRGGHNVTLVPAVKKKRLGISPKKLRQAFGKAAKQLSSQ